MQIPLRQFEQYISETILQRGLSYFGKGHVQSIEEISPGLYESIVAGTEDYTVRLTLENGTITEHICDCPYDYGPVCKHIAAVIFYVQQEELDLQQSSGKKKKAARNSTQKTAARQVDDLLDGLSHNELKRYIKEQAMNDTSFRRELLLKYAHLNEDESKEFYAKQVKGILKKASGRHGFIDWQSARMVGKAVHNLLDTAQKHYKNENYESAIFIACAVLEEMTKALEYADDSNADIGGSIDISYRLLTDIASVKINEEIRKRLYDYAIKAYQRKIFSDWDWHLGMLWLASELFNTEEEADMIIVLLEEPMRSDYEQQEAQTLKMEVFKKIKPENEIDEFIEQNLSNYSLRTEAIRKAISKKDYKKAISYANDGIKQDSKDKPGLVMNWYDWLLKIALEQKDVDKIIEYARLLFVKANKEKQPYYDILKKHIDKNEWKTFVELLVQDFKKRNSWHDADMIAMIYINEKYWDRLLKLVQRECSKAYDSLEYIKRFEQYLVAEYVDELLDLYEQEIINFLGQKTGRKYYKKACRYLRRMKKLGTVAKVNRLIKKLRRTYPRRPALLDELDNV